MDSEKEKLINKIKSTKIGLLPSDNNSREYMEFLMYMSESVTPEEWKSVKRKVHPQYFYRKKS